MSEKPTQPGKRIDKPWGYEILWAETPHYVAKLLFVRAGASLSLQYHRHKEETMYLESGECWIETGDSEDSLVRVPFPVGHAHHIPPGRLHRITAVTDVRIFETSTPHLDDVVRLRDDYGRR